MKALMSILLGLAIAIAVLIIQQKLLGAPYAN